MQFKEEISLLGLMGSRGIQSILVEKKKGMVAGAGSRLMTTSPSRREGQETEGDGFPPARTLTPKVDITSPNIYWRSSVQIHEPVGNISNSNKHSF